MAPLQLRLYKKPTLHRPDLDTEAPRRIRHVVRKAARNAVLNTAELLENVLLHLPARQLFTMKRVSRRFKAAVERSIDVQSKLLLRLQETEESWRVLGEPPSVVLIPQHPGQIFGFANAIVKVARVNGAFFEQPTESADAMANNGGAYVRFHAGMKRSINAFIKYGQPQPWEHMPITDPPCTSARLYLDGIRIGRKHSFSLRAEVTNPDGITLGALLRASFEQKHPEAFNDNGRRCRLRGRNVSEFLAKIAERTRSEVELHRLPKVRMHGVVIPTPAERERMRLQTSGGQAAGEQRRFIFNWPTNWDETKGE